MQNIKIDMHINIVADPHASILVSIKVAQNFDPIIVLFFFLGKSF
jgi:hypothetical protein